jgi:hypothetical protein
VSGQLAGEGCSDVEVVNNDGEIDRRSMVYTEYFARGTEPTITCEVHSGHGLTDGMVGMVADGESPAAPARHENMVVGSLPPPAATSGVVKPETKPETTTATEPNKRGFWGRIFRRPGDPQTQDPDKPKDDPTKPKKKPGQQP